MEGGSRSKLLYTTRVLFVIFFLEYQEKGFLHIHHFPEGYFNLIRNIGLNDKKMIKWRYKFLKSFSAPNEHIREDIFDSVQYTFPVQSLHTCCLYCTVHTYSGVMGGFSSVPGFAISPRGWAPKREFGHAEQPGLLIAIWLFK